MEGYHLKSWKWARSASQAALELAEKYATRPELAAEATRVSKRHDGVWRAANKLVKVDHAGKETRAIVAVRSDAGDSTCPTFLERQGRKRANEMWPVVAACKMLGWTIASASSPPIKREVIATALSFLHDPNFRKMHGIEGLDILIVPQANGMVIAYVLAAFSLNVHTITMPVTLDFNQIIDIDRIYMEPMCACLQLGPYAWIEAQLLRFENGKRKRDRVTLGCFYGKASEEVVIRAAEIEKEKLSNEAQKTLADVESKIATSIELTNRCIEAGDLEAAKAAYGFVGAYIYDATIDLVNYGLTTTALKFKNQVDFSGLTDAPALGSLHDLLMTEVRSLAAPKPYSLPQWRCIELVKINSISDIMSLIDWVREVNE